MRKLLSIAALFLGGAVFAQEQIAELNDVNYYPYTVVSGSMATPCFYAYKHESDETIITVVNGLSGEIKSFSVPHVEYTQIGEIRRRAVSGFIPDRVYSERMYDVQDFTIEEFKDFVENRYSVKLEQRECICTEPIGDGMNKIDFLVTEQDSVSTHYYYMYDEYGTKYPATYWHFTYDDEGNSIAYKIRVSYKEEFMGEWETIDVSQTKKSEYPWYYPVIYMKTNMYSYFDRIMVTSDVLDNDASTYEVLVRRYEIGGLELSYERDDDGNGIMDYQSYSRVLNEVGYDIYSDGVKVAELNVGGTIGTLNVADDAVFIITYTGFYNDAKIYRYDPTTTAVQALHEYKSSGVRMRNDIVEIELAQECSNGTELMVTSLSGQQCVRRQVPAGSKSVTVDTRTLSAGVYNFTVLSGGKVVENGKVVVR